MTKIILSPEEKAILDAIITQRVNSESDIYEYDLKKARDHMSESGISRRLMIPPSAQRAIAIGLAFKHIVDADSIVDAEFINNFRSSQDPSYIPNKSMPKYSWLNNTTWAWEYLQLNGAISIERTYEIHGGGLFIRMTIEEAKKLDDEYLRNKAVSLKFDVNNRCLCIKLGENQDWKNLPALHDESLPYKILHFAWERAGKRVTLQEMFEAGIISERDSKKYMTSIFQRNNAVNALNPKLLELGTDRIIFRKKASYTPDEFDVLTNKLKVLDIF